MITSFIPDEYSEQEARKEFLEKKKQEGFAIRVPDENEILLDIDSPAQYRVYEDQLIRLMRRDAGITTEEWESTTPGHKHISVRMPFTLNDYQRIAYQAVLGSDLRREILSLMRTESGDVMPNCLFEKVLESKSAVKSWGEYHE